MRPAPLIHSAEKTVSRADRLSNIYMFIHNENGVFIKIESVMQHSNYKFIKSFSCFFSSQLKEVVIICEDELTLLSRNTFQQTIQLVTG